MNSKVCLYYVFFLFFYLPIVYLTIQRLKNNTYVLHFKLLAFFKIVFPLYNDVSKKNKSSQSIYY
jgi:hypothetical protein